MRLSDESGYSIIELVLLLAIIGIIGFVGWFVYNSNKKTNETLNNTNQAQTEPAKSAKKSTSPPANQNYLTVKEWSIRFKTNELTNDAEYLIKDEHTLFITTKKYAAIGPNCGLTGEIGYLVRGQAGYKFDPYDIPIENLSYDYVDNSGKKITVTSTHIGSYYYWWVGPQAPCADPSNKNVLSYQDAIVELEKTIEAVPN